MPETEQKLQLGDNESSSFYMMSQLAQNDAELNLNIDGDQLVERTKLFMISHARQQLNRIIKMTKFMEKLEDKFIDAVNNRLDNEPENISMISSTIIDSYELDLSLQENRTMKSRFVHRLNSRRK